MYMFTIAQSVRKVSNTHTRQSLPSEAVALTWATTEALAVKNTKNLQTIMIWGTLWQVWLSEMDKTIAYLFLRPGLLHHPLNPTNNPLNYLFYIGTERKHNFSHLLHQLEVA